MKWLIIGDLKKSHYWNLKKLHFYSSEISWILHKYLFIKKDHIQAKKKKNPFQSGGQIPDFCFASFQFRRKFENSFSQINLSMKWLIIGDYKKKSHYWNKKKVHFYSSGISWILHIYLFIKKDHIQAKKKKKKSVSKWGPNFRFLLRIISISAKIWKIFFQINLSMKWLIIGDC